MSTWELYLIVTYFLLLRNSSSSLSRYSHTSLELDYNQNHPTIDTVTLTQRGYLQFLKYIVDVPPLDEYTFCIWIKSNNYTYSQPLFSYSHNEEERLIRVWVSPQGVDINLEILEVPIFKYPIFFKVNHWYHVCQSWSGHHGAWGLFLNGKLAANGFHRKLAGVTIRPDGDIVVGQEYTDFDKGLEDGIEGEIYGFNFVLESAIAPHRPISNYVGHFDDYNRRRRQQNHRGNDFNYYNARRASNYRPTRNSTRYGSPAKQVIRREPRGFLTEMLHNLASLFGSAPTGKPVVKTIVEFNKEQEEKYRKMSRNNLRQPVPTPANPSARILRTTDNLRRERPLGLTLVELSYDCLSGKGAPLSGDDVLVSWTRTTVRVFGGAILKPVFPFCV